MAVDLTKYSLEPHILVFAYDSDGAIVDRAGLEQDFESRGRFTVFVLL